MAQYEVVMVEIEKIKAAPFNPKDRTEERRLVNLRNSINRHGILQPVILTEDNMLADGHRRLACAKSLGYSHVPAHYAQGSVSELWGINAGNLSVKPSSWMAAVDGGLSIDDVVPEERKRIDDLKRILKEDEFHSLASDFRSPAIYSEARQVAKYLGDQSDASLRKIVLWLNDHAMRYMARLLREGDIEPDILRKAIEENRPIARTWFLA